MRHLRPVQFYGRVWFFLARPRPNLNPPPELRVRSGHWVQPAHREPSLIAPRSFVFLNERGHLDDVGWDGPAREKLWRYNQHYFDDLNARDSQSRADWHRELLASWVQHIPPGSGNAWEPYPTSLRIVNWVKWSLVGNTLPTACLASLAVQARWLAGRMEVHLLGNHLFANAKALVFAGLFFEGPEAAGWLDAGLRILRREVPEQILADGGHFERSTMYHAMALEDMLDLCNLISCHDLVLTMVQRQQAADWRARVPNMVSWLNTLCHPDNEIAFFNDAALDITPTPLELNAYAARLGFSVQPAKPGQSRWLQESGYARLATDKAVALVDLAPVGPDYLPGHAHADTLSFELSVHGQRIWVNSGTSCYGLSAERLRQRGTAAHNTVVVGDNDSSEVWGSFRVARRARLLSADMEVSSGISMATGSHDGYSRLRSRPIHRRRWEMREGCLVVEDCLGDASTSAVARFHFHPGLAVASEPDKRGGSAVLAQGRQVVWEIDQGEAWLEQSTWHPRFGVSLISTCLCVRLVEGKSLVRLRWT